MACHDGVVGEVVDLAIVHCLDDRAVLAEQALVVPEMVGVDLIEVADDGKRRWPIWLADMHPIYADADRGVGFRHFGHGLDRLVCCLE
jgi:hypothetical protein